MNRYLIISIFLLAIVTYMPRVIPLIFNKKIKSKYIKSVLYYMPYCVLSAMTFPSILYSTNNFTFSLIGTVVALGLAYLEKSLIVVALVSSFIIYFLNILST